MQARFLVLCEPLADSECCKTCLLVWLKAVSVQELMLSYGLIRN